MSKDNNNLNQIFGEIRNSLAMLTKKVDDQNSRLRVLENKFLSGETKNSHVEVSVPLPPAPPPVGREDFKDEYEQEIPRPSTAEVDRRGEDGDGDEMVVKSKINIEEMIGGRLFAKIGVFVLFLGVSFLLKYAFDNGDITPGMVVLMGVATGIVLLGIGEKTIKKYSNYGKVTSAGGLGILYLSIFAAYSTWNLMDYTPAFIYMIFVTVAGIAISLRYDCQKLLIGTLLAGFLTPFMVDSQGVNNQFSLLTYVALLDLAILAVSFRKNWRNLTVVGLFGTLIVFSTWFDRFYTIDQLRSTMLFLTFFFLLFSVSALAYNLFKKERSTGIEQMMSLVVGIMFFSSGYALMNADHDLSFLMGFFALVVAIYYFLFAYLVKEITPGDDNLYNFLAFLSIGFISLAIPIQFSEYIITLGWTVEAVLLLVLATQLKGNIKTLVSWFGFGIFGISVVRILGIDARNYTSESSLIFNKVFLTSVFVVVGAYVISYFYSKIKSEAETSKGVSSSISRLIAVVFLCAASFVTVWSVTLDVNTHYSNLRSHEYSRVKEKNNESIAIYGNIDAYKVEVDRDKLRELKERSGLIITIFWLIYGLGLIVIGLKKKKDILFVGGIGMLVSMFVKTIFYDLWSMDVYRLLIVSLMIIACYIVFFILRANKELAVHKNKLAIKKTMVAFVIGANVLTIFFGSNEVSEHYKNRIAQVQEKINNVCSVNNRSIMSKSFSSGYSRNLNYDSAECTSLRAEKKELINSTSVAISIFWLIYAIVLLIYGFVRHYRGVRLGGITLLSVAILKLFFYDLWDQGQLYRIISSISLGIVLLAISFAYNKYKDRVKDII